MVLNLAGKTYEVYTEQGGKWVYEGTHKVKSKAMEHAEGLMNGARISGVRVVAESERSGEEVVFEQAGGTIAKAISAAAIETSPVCNSVNDLYGFEARRTGGRLMRRYLDDVGMTATELLFDPGHLRMLERNESLLNGALGRLGAVQAKTTGEKTALRTEKLYDLFARLQKKSRAALEADVFREVVHKQGLNALISHVEQTISEDMERRVHALNGLAGVLGEQGDWGGKLEALVALLGDAPCLPGRVLVDELMAEILDGNQAVSQVLGGAADLSQAQMRLIYLADGRLPEVKNAISCINVLNGALATHDLPITRQVLLDRVAAGLRGVNPLTKEGRVKDRGAFAKLIKELADPTGFDGGAEMAEALTLRAKMALAGADGDLPSTDAIATVKEMHPILAGQIGFLLDLAPTPTGAKQQPFLVQTLADCLKRAASGAGLGATDADLGLNRAPDAPPSHAHLVAALNGKLKTAGFPEDAEDAIHAALDCVAKQPPRIAAPEENGGDGATDADCVEKAEAIPVPPTPGTTQCGAEMIRPDDQRRTSDRRGLDRRDGDRRQADRRAEARPEDDRRQSNRREGPRREGPRRGAQSGDKRVLLAGEVLFEQGEPGTEAYLLLSGEIEIFHRRPRERTLARLGRGELFGELSLIDDQPRMASAKARQESEILVISKDSLKDRMAKLEQSDKVLWRLFEVLANRLRGACKSGD